MKNKNIFILSYWDSQINYGQILQGVALQYVLKVLGYAPQTLRYNVDYLSAADKKRQNSVWYRFYKLFTDDTSIIEHLKRHFKKNVIQNNINANLIDRHFDDFKRRNLTLSSSEYNEYSDFVDISNEAYAIIVGSDQVWNHVSLGNRRSIFLLDFVKSPAKKIAYAASFGRSRFANHKELKDFKKSLASFDAVSVRENSGLDMCHEAHCSSAMLVPDPTLLLDKQQWLSISVPNKIEKNNKIAFVYTLVANDIRIHQYVDYYRNLGYKIVYVSSDVVHDVYENTLASLDDWLYYISIADVVITNSFHGLVFSLNFNVLPICVTRGDNMKSGLNSRIYSILSHLNLLRLFVMNFNDDTAKSLIDSEIDWNFVNEKFLSLRKIGMDFLKSNL